MKKTPEDKKKKPEMQDESAEEVKDTAQETVPETPETETPEAAEETAATVDAQLTAVAAELEETKNKYLRMAAEYENYRKRSAKERESIYSDAQAQTVMALLPVLDNLERAASQPTQDEAFLKGVELTLKQFYDCLTKLGVKEIPALGEQFDPNFHNAVMHVEQDGCDDNTVVEVFQKGFILGEKVIRHAIVKVAN